MLVLPTERTERVRTMTEPKPPAKPVYCPHGWWKGEEWCPVCTGEETEEEYYGALDHEAYP